MNMSMSDPEWGMPSTQGCRAQWGPQEVRAGSKKGRLPFRRSRAKASHKLCITLLLLSARGSLEAHRQASFLTSQPPYHNSLSFLASSHLIRDFPGPTHPSLPPWSDVSCRILLSPYPLLPHCSLPLFLLTFHSHHSCPP